MSRFILFEEELGKDLPDLGLGGMMDQATGRTPVDPHSGGRPLPLHSRT